MTAPEMPTRDGYPTRNTQSLSLPVTGPQSHDGKRPHVGLRSVRGELTSNSN